jgi:two-component system response regulator DesR
VIRILLAEPMSLLRGALATVLAAEPDLEIAGESARIEELVPLARAVRPDIVLLSVDLLLNTGMTTLDELEKEAPDCALVVLVDVDTPGAVGGDLQPRAHGFVSKDTAPAQLAEYLRQVAVGERVIDPALAVAAWSAPPNPLTLREREVLRVAAWGLPSAEIAKTLHLSVGTVRNYLSSIMRKTGARNRLEAVRIATESGWL